MLKTIKRSLDAFSNKIRRPPAGMSEEKWTADFTKPDKSRFDIKPEISRNAYLEEGSLVLNLKKNSSATRIETSGNSYADQIINVRFRFNGSASGSSSCCSNCCSAGIMFRVTDKGNYCFAHISAEGNFRFDSVNNGVSTPLINLKEATNPKGKKEDLKIIARDDNIIFILNGKWIAETRDGSVSGGRLGFALVSCDSGNSGIPEKNIPDENCECQARLDFLSVDSREVRVSAEYEKWKDSAEINAESRLRLAESCASLDLAEAAYEQILKAWKRREEAARSVTATYTEMRARRELLLAARMAGQLGQCAAAEEYINVYFSMTAAGDDLTETMSEAMAEAMAEALAEKAKILCSLGKYEDLAAFLPEYISRMEKSPDNNDNETRPNVMPKGLSSLYALLGYAYWNLKNIEAAAEAYSEAVRLSPEIELYKYKLAEVIEQARRDFPLAATVEAKTGEKKKPAAKKPAVKTPAVPLPAELPAAVIPRGKKPAVKKPAESAPLLSPVTVKPKGKKTAVKKSVKTKAAEVKTVKTKPAETKAVKAAVAKTTKKATTKTAAKKSAAKPVKKTAVKAEPKAAVKKTVKKPDLQK